MSRRRSSRNAARVDAANASGALYPGVRYRFRGAGRPPVSFVPTSAASAFGPFRRAAARLVYRKFVPRPVRFLIRTGLGDRWSPLFRSGPARPVLDKRLRECVRRRERREVLFAGRLTGQGAHGKKVMRLESSYTCK